MKIRQFIKLGSALLMGAALSVCSTGAPPDADLGTAEPTEPTAIPENHTRILAVSIHDKKPEKAGITIERIDLHITRVELVASSGNQILVTETDAAINLLDFTAENAFQLLDHFKDVPSQSYKQMRFITASNTVTVSGPDGVVTEPLKLPSGSTSGLKLNIAAENQSFGDGCNVSLDVDINPDEDIVIAGNKYLLKPTHDVAVSSVCPGGDYEVVHGIYDSAAGLTLSSADGSVSLTLPAGGLVAEHGGAFLPVSDMEITMRVYGAPDVSALPSYLVPPAAQAAGAPIDRVVELLPHGISFKPYAQLTIIDPGVPLLLHGCRISNQLEVIDCAVYKSVLDAVDAEPAYSLEIPGFFSLVQLTNSAAIQSVLQFVAAGGLAPNTPHKPNPSYVQGVAISHTAQNVASVVVSGAFALGEVCGAVTGCGGCCLCVRRGDTCSDAGLSSEFDLCGSCGSEAATQIELYYSFGSAAPSLGDSMISLPLVAGAQSVAVDIPLPPGPSPDNLTVRTRAVNYGFTSELSNFETAAIPSCAECCACNTPNSFFEAFVSGSIVLNPGVNGTCRNSQSTGLVSFANALAAGGETVHSGSGNWACASGGGYPGDVGTITTLNEAEARNCGDLVRNALIASGVDPGVQCGPW